MTSKEKAKDLLDSFIWNCKHTEYVDDNRYKDNETIRLINSKKCALIGVDYTLEALEHNHWENIYCIGYYNEVKREINKI
tara:strand:- start:424 stop:663 length:240 start_codon:yes stop_codon:yes gene_type:complete